MNKRLLLINSSVAFSLALLLTITIHEFGHAIAALVLGFHPVVHTFSVDTNVITNQQHVITLLSGPIVSLVLGLVFLNLPIIKNSFWRLVLLWMGLLGVQEFFGYLMTAPFKNVGDISSALQRLGAPLPVTLVVFAIGCAGTFMAGRIATKRLLGLTNSKETVAPQLRQLGLFAWLLGTGITLVLSIGSLNLAADGIFEIFGLLTSGIFLTLVRYFMPKTIVDGEGVGFNLPIAGIIFLVVVAIFRQVILGSGLHL